VEDSQRGKRFVCRPIGVIHTPFQREAGTPIQPIMASDEVVGRVEVFPEYVDGLKDLEAFDRVWLLYWCHRARRVGPDRLRVQPYMDSAERGLFATRAPSRPNPIGMSPVRLQRIEGNVLYVAQIDILDGTPLLDIKPYVPRFDAFPDSACGWLERQVHRKRGVRADGRFEQDPGGGATTANA